MKTLLVCGEIKRAKHVGEEYDEIIYVTDAPDVTNIKANIYKVMDAVRRLNAQDTDSKEVKVSLDAAPPFIVAIEQVINTMKTNENINVSAPDIQ